MFSSRIHFSLRALKLWDWNDFPTMQFDHDCYQIFMGFIQLPVCISSFFPSPSLLLHQSQLKISYSKHTLFHIAAHLASLSWKHLLISEPSYVLFLFFKIHTWHLCEPQVELVTLQNRFRFFHSTCYYVLLKVLWESKVQIAPPMAVAKNNPLPTEEHYAISVYLPPLGHSHISPSDISWNFQSAYYY